MTRTLPFKTSGSTNPFDDMFSETHGGSTDNAINEIDWGDKDLCEHDDFEENSNP